ncbi:MAG: hypothetical protein V7676_05230 [Parasphingorhabdus sp.]|uniref:hypothetical protein n=1 Tax=Parasphingorhabdus sp. TaxID=2709688 RepID=UPI003001ECA8
MRWAEAAIAVGSFVMLSACSLNAPVAEREAEPPREMAAASLCAPDEETLYYCPHLPFETVSMCLGDKNISHRTGLPDTDDPDAHDMIISSDANWSNIHLGHVTGGGGGHQKHVRFTAPDGKNFLILEGAPGQYHDGPSGPWNGVTVVAPDGEEKGWLCKAGAVLTPDWFDLIAKRAPVDLQSLMEEEGSRFDGWY